MWIDVLLATIVILLFIGLLKQNGRIKKLLENYEFLNREFNKRNTLMDANANVVQDNFSTCDNKIREIKKNVDNTNANVSIKLKSLESKILQNTKNIKNVYIQSNLRPGFRLLSNDLLRGIPTKENKNAGNRSDTSDGRRKKGD